MNNKLNEPLFHEIIQALAYLENNPKAYLQISSKRKEKAYNLSLHYDEIIKAYYGEIIVNKDVLTFIGDDIGQLANALKESIKDYVNFKSTPI